MTPEQFIARWKNNPLSERAGAQAHFDDLCELLGVDKPRDPANYCFERGARKASGGDGWADVWKRGHFGWENKKPGRDLRAALKQLTDYALELENPPLLVVSDRERIVIHTAFTGYPDQPRLIRLDDIGAPENLQTLRWVFTDPERLRPVKSLAAITEEAAGRFGALAEALRLRGEPAQRVAHFLTQCLFCMFAEDEALLPGGMFTRLLDKADDPARATNRIAVLFAAMQSGGDYGDDVIPWFNGGLFATVDVPALTAADLAELREAARMDWRAIDPSIFGTLFERGLNPKKRAQLGAHYTDPGTIMKLIEPVIQRPLLAEWAGRRDAIAASLAKSKKQGDKAWREAEAGFHGFLERLKGYRVLDAACGSGNFLYLALKTLKDIERRVNTEAEQLGLHRQVSIEVSPANVLGIELDPYAAELARVTVWIGEIQWMLQNGYAVADRPILKPLDTIENRDALVNADGSEAAWPACDAVVGNPPFVGNKKMRGELGDAYVDTLRAAYVLSLPGGADLVTYWFEKARAQIENGQCQCAGLVATQAIRKGANRVVLDRITASTRIFDAWSDEAWVNDGAAVRVSLVAFGHTEGARLNGEIVAGIQADLSSAAGFDLTRAIPLLENAKVCFMGTSKVGSFDVPGSLARDWLQCPNPNGRATNEVLRPWANGQDLAGRPSDTWIIDFGVDMSEVDASMYEVPFSHVESQVRPVRADQRRDAYRLKWWIHAEARPGLRAALRDHSRFIATPRVAKHRFFVWLPVAVLPDSRLYAICRDDDCTFGVLSARFHQVWALANASRHGDGDEGGRPTYNARDCFETFPFPAGLTPRDTAGRGAGATICDSHEAPPAPGSPYVTTPGSPCVTPPQPAPATNAQAKEHAEAIAAAARRLDDLRNNWLNPPEWVDWVISPEEEKAGFPKRPAAKPGHEADLKKRTLTNLYNVRPAWLDGAHKALDAAVAAAYGWADYTPAMPDDEILRRLLALNLERATP